MTDKKSLHFVGGSVVVLRSTVLHVKQKYFNKLKMAKASLIKSVTERVFTFIRGRNTWFKKQPTELTDLVAFIQIFKYDGIAEFKFGDAKHLPELKEIKERTAIREFLATVQAYYDTLVVRK
jgi:hypothetical protein